MLRRRGGVGEMERSEKKRGKRKRKTSWEGWGEGRVEGKEREKKQMIRKGDKEGREREIRGRVRRG